MTTPEKKYNMLCYFKQAVYESQILIPYLTSHSSVVFDTKSIEILIKSQHMIEENNWTSKDELHFWHAYDKLASSIKPVTVESLKAIIPNPIADNKTDGQQKKKKMTEAAFSVLKYRIFTGFSLALLLLVQIYWINGSDLIVTTKKLFSQIDEISFDIKKKKQDKNYKGIDNDIEIEMLNKKKKAFIQEFGATYQLLQDWNRCWQVLTFKKQFEPTATNYVQKKYEKDIKDIEMLISDIQQTFKNKGIEADIKKEKSDMLSELNSKKIKRKFDHEFDKERNKLFLTKISAEFVIRSLQTYALPLLYGLLGAIIYTLRNLAVEIKNLTYTGSLETKYSLRITMGLLGGIAIGWFLKPKDFELAGSLSPMALSFLIGYNVEVLFTLMDKLIETILKLIPAAVQNKKPQSEKKEEIITY